MGGRRDRGRGVRRRRPSSWAGWRPTSTVRTPTASSGRPGRQYRRQGLPRWSRRVDAARTGPAAADATAPTSGRLHRDGPVWLLEWRGRRSTVPDSKGLRDLAVLLARPGRAVPALDLVEAAGGPPAAAAGADLGPVLDDTARQAYRRRLGELDREIDEAESDADLGRLERLRTERSLLADELAGALGLGGRARIAGDPTERARKAVTMRIRAAIAHDRRARRAARPAPAQRREDRARVQLRPREPGHLARLTREHLTMSART